MRREACRWTIAVALSLLAGCAVGPDFEPPAAPVVSGYTPRPLPERTSAASPSRNKTATGAVSPASASGKAWYTLHAAQLAVSYMPDVFGGTRRQVEALEATAEYQRFQLEAAYLTLTSNVVAAAVQEASLRDQIAATQEIIKIESQSLDILRKQFQLGQVAGLDVAAVEAALAQAQATLPPLQKQLAYSGTC